MNFFNQTIPANIPLDGKEIQVSVNFDLVEGEVYLNDIIYEGTDVMSIVDDSVETKLCSAILKTLIGDRESGR